MQRGAFVVPVILVTLASHAVFACGPGARSSTSEAPAVASSASTASNTERDAGAERVCTFDGKDLGPCADDCDRAIVFACTVLATRLERGEQAPRDATRALRLYERACDLHDAASCVSAARMHASGTGVPPSRTRQIELLSVACHLGDAIACAIPAKALATGNGVARDEARAKELWQRACAGGVQSACDATGDLAP